MLPRPPTCIWSPGIRLMSSHFSFGLINHKRGAQPMCVQTRPFTVREMIHHSSPDIHTHTTYTENGPVSIRMPVLLGAGTRISSFFLLPPQPKSWLSIISRLLRKKMEDNQCNDQRVSSTLPLFNNEGRKMGFLILLRVKERWLKRGAKAAGMEKRS